MAKGLNDMTLEDLWENVPIGLTIQTIVLVQDKQIFSIILIIASVFLKMSYVKSSLYA